MFCPRRWVMGICVGWVMIHRWWLNEWMNEWLIEASEEPLVSFCISFRMSHGSLTIPGLTCSLQKVSSYSISTPWTSGGGFGRQHPIRPTLLSWTFYLKIAQISHHTFGADPGPGYKKTCLGIYDLSWFIYQSFYVFIHLYITIPTLSPIIMEVKKLP